MKEAEGKTTHFGYETLPESEKARRVAEVFDAVSARYDLMNDLMSGGMHRCVALCSRAKRREADSAYWTLRAGPVI